MGMILSNGNRGSEGQAHSSGNPPPNQNVYWTFSTTIVIFVTRAAIAPTAARIGAKAATTIPAVKGISRNVCLFRL